MQLIGMLILSLIFSACAVTEKSKAPGDTANEEKRCFATRISLDKNVVPHASESVEAECEFDGNTFRCRYCHREECIWKVEISFEMRRSGSP